MEKQVFLLPVDAVPVALTKNSVFNYKFFLMLNLFQKTCFWNPQNQRFDH